MTDHEIAQKANHEEPGEFSRKYAVRVNIGWTLLGLLSVGSIIMSFLLE